MTYYKCVDVVVSCNTDDQRRTAHRYLNQALKNRSIDYPSYMRLYKINKNNCYSMTALDREELLSPTSRILK